MKLRDKIALVTGGTHGIGEAIVRRFVAEGARVAATYHADGVKAEALEAELGDAVKTFKADFSLVPEIDSMMGSVMATFGGVDILVNNSGTITFAPVEETTESIWDEQVDLNLKGPFFLVKAVLPSFRSRGGGKVINIGSIAGIGGVPNCAGYCASKGGLTNLTKALAVELAKENINVNHLAPGNVATRLNEHMRGPEHTNWLQDRTASGRDFLSVGEMTGTAVFLACEDSSVIHGETIMVDGGWTIW